MGKSRSTFIDRSRPWRAVLAGLGGLWALAILPFPATEFGVPLWTWVFRYRPYFWAREQVHDPYIVFGALSALAFLAIGLALLPDLRRAGWGGAVMAWLIIAGAPVTAISYLNTPNEAPLHVMWGAEAFPGRLEEALADGRLPRGRLSDMVRRILRSIYAIGVDRWEPVPDVDMAAHDAVALEIARRGIVLLENDGILPFAPDTAARIAVIGGHAQVGVPTGCGSSAVTPPAEWVVRRTSTLL